jgi:hypothetical protein
MARCLKTLLLLVAIYWDNNGSSCRNWKQILYLNVKGKNRIMKWESKKEPPAKTRSSNLFKKGKGE